MLETLARLYAAYFPPLFQLEVFNRETDARNWAGRGTDEAPTSRAKGLTEEEFQVERRGA